MIDRISDLSGEWINPTSKMCLCETLCQEVEGGGIRSGVFFVVLGSSPLCPILSTSPTRLLGTDPKENVWELHHAISEVDLFP